MAVATQSTTHILYTLPRLVSELLRIRYHLYLQVFRVCPPALVPIRRRRIRHACQRVRMIYSELWLAHLYPFVVRDVRSERSL